MLITPAIKGQITKATRNIEFVSSSPEPLTPAQIYGLTVRKIQGVFVRHMPREQAKHAARRYLRTNML